MTIIDGRRVLDTKAVADLAGCTTSNIRALVLRGRIPAPVGKVGQSWVFDEPAIMAWLPNRARRGSGVMSEDGRRRAAVHAEREWTCPCGQVCRGNGGRTGHQRACLTYQLSVAK